MDVPDHESMQSGVEHSLAEEGRIELLLRRPWKRDRVPAPAGRSVIDELAARRER